MSSTEELKMLRKTAACDQGHDISRPNRVLSGEEVHKRKTARDAIGECELAELYRGVALAQADVNKRAMEGSEGMLGMQEGHLRMTAMLRNCLGSLSMNSVRECSDSNVCHQRVYGKIGKIGGRWGKMGEDGGRRGVRRWNVREEVNDCSKAGSWEQGGWGKGEQGGWGKGEHLGDGVDPVHTDGPAHDHLR
jgi:hypothetical protein